MTATLLSTDTCAGVRRLAAVAACGMLLSMQAYAQPSPSWFAPTLVDDAPPAPAVHTQHEGTFNGSALTFEAVTGETPLPGADGQPATTVFSTAYIRTDTGAGDERPVLFLFNGGPGASSSPLHLGLGPVRRSPSESAGALVPNPSSVLDAVDIVFVDPPGTGYSRLFREGAGEAFWGIEEDADAVLLFIRDWLEAHDRSASPIFVMGESYGATRAVAILARTRDVRFAGALLLSAALDYTADTPVVGNNLPYVFLLPSMAVTAAYHGVVERDDKSFLEVFEEAAAFAQAEYAAALYQGNLLDDGERRHVAAEMARLTGLAEDYVLAENLRVDGAEFGDALLGDRGLRTGRLDTRITGKIADFKDERPPRDDPSMVGNGGGRSTGELLDDYFRGVLETRIDRPYRKLNLDLNSKWNYEQEDAPRFYLTAVPLLEQALKEHPDIRIFIGGGLFDFGTPVMAPRYAASQIDVAPERFTFVTYDAGHSVFDHEESRVKLGNDIRAFVASALDSTRSP